MTKLEKIINFTQSPWLKTLYKKYINPLKEVKHEKKPVNIIFSLVKLNFFAITKPKNNEPITESIRS